jgi:hypothetical protein
MVSFERCFRSVEDCFRKILFLFLGAAYVVRRSSKMLQSGSKSRAVFRRNIESTGASVQSPDAAFTYQYENASSVSSPDSLKSPPPQFFDEESDPPYTVRGSISATNMISSVVSSLVSPSSKNLQKSTTTPAVLAAQQQTKVTAKKSLIPGFSGTKNTSTSRLFTSSNSASSSTGIISSSSVKSEPKPSSGITNIGGAVMRSKTADFERMMSSKPSRSATFDTDTGNNNSAAQASGKSLVDTTGRKTQIYKRQELISSSSGSGISGPNKTVKKSK